VLHRSFNWPHADIDRFVSTGGPLERCFVAVEGDSVRGFSRVRPFGQYYGGRSVPMAGVSPVGVDPEYRGRGLASQLTSAHFGPARERGEVISGLYPASTRLYRGVGYEVAGLWAERIIPIRSLQQLQKPAGVTVRRATPDDWPAVKDCYQRLAPTRAGWLDRPEVWWDRLLVQRGDDLFVYVVDGPDGSIAGYISYRHTADPHRSFGYIIAVAELVAAEVDVTLALWRLVASSATMVTTVRMIGPAEHPLLLLLPEQDLTGGTELRYLLRVVDAPGAVAARGFPPVSMAVEVELADKQCDWNVGRWRLSVEEGRGRLEKATGSQAGAAVTMGIAAFSSLYAGYSSARTLAESGLVHGASERELVALDALFSGPTPWMPDFF